MVAGLVITIAFLVVSVQSFTVQAWAFHQLHANRTRGGVWRTAACRVACAVIYVAVGTNALWGHLSTLYVSLAAFLITQLTWQYNAWLDVRAARRRGAQLMDAATLLRVMPGLSAARAQQLIAGCNEAMTVGGITTVRRAEFFLAQIGHESVSLLYQQEIGSSDYLRGQPYWPYIGRTFIQVTWRSNYAAFGAWCRARGLLSDPNHFVTYPSALAADEWAWLGAVWFWTTHGLNGYADRNDFTGATQRINGGQNGAADRTARLRRCIAQGTNVLPAAPPAPVAQEGTDMAFAYQVTNIPGGGGNCFLKDGAEVSQLTSGANALAVAAATGRPITSVAALPKFDFAQHSRWVKASTKGVVV